MGYGGLLEYERRALFSAFATATCISVTVSVLEFSSMVEIETLSNYQLRSFIASTLIVVICAGIATILVGVDNFSDGLEVIPIAIAFCFNVSAVSIAQIRSYAFIKHFALWWYFIIMQLWSSQFFLFHALFMCLKKPVKKPAQKANSVPRICAPEPLKV